MTKHHAVSALVFLASCFNDPQGSEDLDNGSATLSTETLATTSVPSTFDETDDITSDTTETTPNSSTSEDQNSSSDSSSSDFPLPSPNLWYPLNGDPDDEVGDADGVEVGDVSYVTGYDGLAADLTLDGAYIDASAFAAEYVAAHDSVSVAFRMWTERYEGLEAIVALGGEGDQGLDTNAFVIQARDGKFEVYTETGELGEDHVSYLGPLPSTGAWHGVVFVFDGGVARCFVDGALQEETGYVPAETTSDRLWVGGFWTGAWFGGMTDDLRVYSFVLSNEEAELLSGV